MCLEMDFISWIGMQENGMINFELCLRYAEDEHLDTRLDKLVVGYMDRLTFKISNPHFGGVKE